MTLTLSTKDQSLLAAATRTLVSPLVQPTFEHWLSEVNRTLKPLLGADKASFMFPLDNGEVRTASDEIPSRILIEYVRERLPAQERRWGIRRRSVALGVWNRRQLYGRHVRDLYRSEYYNDFLVPQRAFDPIGLTAGLDTSEQVVNLYFHHERPTGRRFGARGLALLRMLQPAFKAGVQAARVLFQQRELIERLADAITTGVALTDRAGRVLHRNSALQTMALEDAEWAVVETMLSTVVVSCGESCAGQKHANVASTAFRQTVRTATATYVITTTPLNQGHLTRELMLAVLVERSGPPPFPEAALRERYGLTARELEVARHLCEGATSAQVASALAVSISTARHHAERIMLKLHVHSRAQIPAAVARCRDSTTS